MARSVCQLLHFHFADVNDAPGIVMLEGEVAFFELLFKLKVIVNGDELYEHLEFELGYTQTVSRNNAHYIYILFANKLLTYILSDKDQTCKTDMSAALYHWLKGFIQ